MALLEKAHGFTWVKDEIVEIKANEKSKMTLK